MAPCAPGTYNYSVRRERRRMLMDANPLPYALGSEAGEALWFFGTLATFKATAEQTGGRYTLIEQVGSPRCRHPPACPAGGRRVVLRARRRAHVLPRRRPTHTRLSWFVRAHPQGDGARLPGRLENREVPRPHHAPTRTLHACCGRASARESPPACGSAGHGEGWGSAAQEYGVELLDPPPGAHEA